MKSVSDLFGRSDAVAEVFFDAGTFDPFDSGYLMRGSVNWAFKGALNGDNLYFNCRVGCELGVRAFVFLKRTGKKLGQAQGPRAQPLDPLFPKQADYFRPTAWETYHFPIVGGSGVSTESLVVTLPEGRSGLPSQIQQGRLENGPHSLKWWASFEGVKSYLISLAVDEAKRHP